MKREVWVLVQREKNKIAEISLELLGKGRHLADKLDAVLAAIIIGKKVSELPSSLIAHGADKVYLAQHEQLDSYNTLPYTKVLVDLISRFKPEIFLLGATALGRDLAPRVASHLKVGITADCTEFTIDHYTETLSKQRYKNILMQIRPAFGGNIIATIVSPKTRPQMATVREGVMRALPPDATRKGEVISLEPELAKEDFKLQVLERKAVEKKVNLKTAGIIVAGGAGVGSKENFQLIFKLASCLGAAVGASRAAVDGAFIHHDHQIGQTGTTVRPRLYIACGISGAVQHRAGMSESNKIIAINPDPEAPIFEIAHYGIVGDLKEVIPKMIAAYKAKNSGGKNGELLSR
jgi:electron transfer flavoprotein alpha subunit